MWKLKLRQQNVKSTPRNNLTQLISNHVQLSSHQKYVPKKLLAAQCGQGKIWIPKQLPKPHIGPIEINVKTQKNRKLPTNTLQKITKKWVPKQAQPTTDTPKPKATLVLQPKPQQSKKVASILPKDTNFDWNLQFLSKQQVTFDE